MIDVAIVGFGSAGRSRARVMAASPSFAVRGVVSRRGAAALEVAAGPGPAPALLSWGDVLEDRSITAVAICTENEDHAPRVQAALDAGKHVLVEYPLALSSAAGRGLLARADRTLRVVHEGHVELVADPHVALRQALTERAEAGDAPRIVELTFTGGPGKGGFPSFSGFARLHRLVDLFGRLRVVDVRLHEGATPRGMMMEVTFAAERGATVVRWRETRGEELARRTDCVVSYESGEVRRGYGQQRPGPVFARDSERFARVVAGGVDVSDDRARIEHCLDLAQEIRARGLTSLVSWSPS